ncbi:MAG: carbohydrate ABC transporter permease [Anaerolineaceae bacterium]|nr:carbohydrate ABC transporter permease [Anaerolineaceae bacterium]
MINKESFFRKFVRTIFLIAILLLYCFPLYWMLVTSLQPVGGVEGDRTPYIVPKSITYESYEYILNQEGFSRQYRNSTVVAVGTTVSSCVLATLAGYGFSRYKFKGRDTMSTGILVFQMIPKDLLIIPFFLLMRKFGLLSSNFGLIIAYTSFALPFCIWMLIGFFNSIPTDLDECAMIDGATKLQAFVRIILPLASPGIAATALFAFVISWSEYLFAIVLAVDYKSALLPQGLAAMSQEYQTLYEPMFAGSILVVLPVVLIYIFLEKYFVSGLTAGAIKG